MKQFSINLDNQQIVLLRRKENPIRDEVCPIRKSNFGAKQFSINLDNQQIVLLRRKENPIRDEVCPITPSANETFKKRTLYMV